MNKNTTLLNDIQRLQVLLSKLYDSGSFYLFEHPQKSDLAAVAWEVTPSYDAVKNYLTFQASDMQYALFYIPPTLNRAITDEQIASNSPLDIAWTINALKDEADITRITAEILSLSGVCLNGSEAYRFGAQLALKAADTATTFHRYYIDGLLAYNNYVQQKGAQMLDDVMGWPVIARDIGQKG